MRLSSFYIDWLEVYNNEHYHTTAAEGLSAPEFRLASHDNAGRDGASVGSGLYGSRLVTLAGNLSADSSELYKYKRRDLATACRLRRNDTGLPEPTPFTFTVPDGEVFTFGGFVKSLRMTLEQPTYGEFFISVLVPDPFLYAGVEQTTGEKTRPAGGGTTWPVTWPATWGASTGGTATIDNYGNADAWPVVTLRGPLTSPYIYSVARGKLFKLAYTLATGDVVVIDMRAKTVMLNGTTSLVAYKSADSDWFSLAPEVDNVLSFTTASSADTGTMEVTWAATYLGL